MNVDWRTRIKAVYLAASGQKREERQRYLDEVCGDDEAMRREVESLLLERDQTEKPENVSVEVEAGDWRSPDHEASRTENAARPPTRDPTSRPTGVGDSIGRYRIVSLVGEGGMGRVYEAEDPELKRRIALKVLPESLATDPKALKRFKREAQTVAALSHPGIVTLHSVEESEGTHFLTMELVRGDPLSRLIPEDGFDLKELLEIAIPMVDGLRAAHERGVVHRDLKPGNVMVDRESRVRILDFGLAKLTDLPGESTEAALTALTALGTIVGTVPYMSPEQVADKPVDQRSDIFSLGIILYEMCTGRRPFAGKTPNLTMTAILRDRPERVSEIRDDLPEHLGRIVRRCLEKEPEKRYQSAQVVRDELEELKREVESGPTMVYQQPVAASPPSRRLWIGLAASLAVLAAVAFFFFWPSGQDSEGPKELTGQVSSVTPDRKMIVVLPFENLGDTEDEYFAAGMTDEINSRLSKVTGLGVISRDSAILYAETQKTTAQIGDELSVEFLLGGTVRWALSQDGGSRIRITPRLVRVADDTQLWSDSYDRVLDDVFDIQSDIAAQVVSQMGVNLLETERLAMAERPTENLEAYQALLKGSKATGKDCRKQEDAIRELDRAVELDSKLVQAWVILAFRHDAMATWCQDPKVDHGVLARKALERALQLAPESLNTLDAAATLAMRSGDYDGAMAWIEAAGDRIESSSSLLHRKAAILRRQGRWQEAIGTYERALMLDPRGFNQAHGLAVSHTWMRDYPKALTYYDQAISLRPDSTEDLQEMAEIFWLWTGDTQGARVAMESISESLQKEGPVQWAWFWQEIYEGHYEAALERLEGDWGASIHNALYAWPRALYEALAQELLERPDQARESYEAARQNLAARLEMAPQDSRAHRALAIVLAGLGRGDEALIHNRRAREIYPLEVHPWWGTASIQNLALILTMTGDYDGAFEQLDFLLARPALLSIPLLELDPRWAPLRDDPRFEALKLKYGKDDDQDLRHEVESLR